MAEANSRETKKEVFAAYNELLGKLQGNKATTKVTRLKDEKEAIQYPEERRQAEELAKFTPQDLSRMFSELKRTMVDSLRDLEQEWVEQQQKLVMVRQSIDFSNKELKDLYDIRANADTLAALLMAQREKAQEFEKELSEKTRKLHQQEQEFNYQRDLTKERDRVEYETRLRHFEEKESNFNARIQQMQDEFRRAMDDERHRIEQEMRLKFDYETKLLHKEMDTERHMLKQQIVSLEAKIAHLESLKYSFNKLSFNSTPIDSLE